MESEVEFGVRGVGERNGGFDIHGNWHVWYLATRVVLVARRHNSGVMDDYP